MTKPLNILVVDDYEITRQQVCQVFAQLNFTFAEAQNGLEALQLIKQQKFDAVFSDIVMPEMDGFELCEEIRKAPEFKNIPIVVLSTHCDSNYIVKALRHGADDYIAKPVNLPVILKVLERMQAPFLS